MIVELPDHSQVTFVDRPGRRMILLRVNTVCNLKCGYCWYVINPGLHVPVREEQTPSSMSKMLTELAPRPGDIVYLSGGEAILRKDIRSVCKRLHQSGATVYLTTNGMLLKRLLEVAPWIDGYVVSVDSATAEYHDEHRGGHTETLRNVARLRQVRPVCVTVVVSRQNLDDLIPLVDLCIDLKVESVFWQLLWLPPEHPERPTRCLGTGDLVRFQKCLMGLRERRARIRIPATPYLRLLEATVRVGRAEGVVSGCFAWEGYRATDAYGEISRCLPHAVADQLRAKRDPKVPVPLVGEGGRCPHFSEECSCLMGHFFTDLFDDSDR